jgi:CubicO group peptidase (beta-lactamase class C family)
MINKRKWSILAAVAGVAALAVVVALVFAARARPRPSAPAAPPARDYWPTAGWRASPPEEHGFDSAKLAEALYAMRDQGMDIHSLMLIRHGYVLFEAYFYPYDGESLHDMASVTKSLTGVLTGLAIDQGYLELDEPMLSFFPGRDIANVDARKERITVRHLASMSSGLECAGMAGGEPTLQEMLASPDWVQFSLDRPMAAEPGERFVYDSPALHLLSPILQEATGLTEYEFARRNLFEPLGIRDSLWLADPQGYTAGSGDAFLHPRDAAKIGYLWLNQGQWEGGQIVSREWVSQSVTAQVRADGPEDYGYGWWVARDSDVGPAYLASGRGGQRIHVLPTLDLVIVTTGGGFEPGAATDLLRPAIGDLEQPLLPNPAGVAQLQAALQAVRQPPAPQPMPPLPGMAEAVSGRTYRFEPNDLRLATLRLDFGETAEATLRVTFADGRPERAAEPVGLDGLYRFAPGSHGLPAGRRGQWTGPDTLVIEEDWIAFNHAYDITARFDGDRLTLVVAERGSPAGVTLAGRQE